MAFIPSPTILDQECLFVHIDRQVGGKGGARRKGEKGEKGEEVKDGVISEPKLLGAK